MKQFKALIIKEWHTHNKVFLIPAFILGAFILLFSVLSIYGSIRFGVPLWNVQDTTEIDAAKILRDMFYVLSVVLGWFAMLTTITLNENMLNNDHQKKCEIMHHSQPVSLIKMLGAKLTLSIPIMIVQYVILAVLSSLLLSSVFSLFGFNSWISGIYAVLYPVPIILMSMIIVSSIFWLFSCAFRKQSALKLWIILIVVELMRFIMQRFWVDFKMFSPISYYFKIITLPLTSLHIDQTGINFLWNPLDMSALTSYFAIAFLLYIAGYFLYKRRELS